VYFVGVWVLRFKDRDGVRGCVGHLRIYL